MSLGGIGRGKLAGRKTEASPPSNPRPGGQDGVSSSNQASSMSNGFGNQENKSTNNGGGGGGFGGVASRDNQKSSGGGFGNRDQGDEGGSAFNKGFGNRDRSSEGGGGFGGSGGGASGGGGFGKSSGGFGNNSTDSGFVSSSRDDGGQRQNTYRTARSGQDNEEDDNPTERKAVTYVPEDVDPAEIWAQHINQGINFNRYFDIEVQRTGDDVPRPLGKTFADAGIAESLCENLRRMKFQQPTPIQAECIPAVLSGRDVMGCAQTGSGKTAAFLLPMVSWILDQKPEDDSTWFSPFALIITPTRELTTQIHREAIKICDGTPVKSVEVYGGVASRHQRSKMRDGCDIVVATIGKLLMFIDQGTIRLNRLHFVVLDEADRMLDQGFEKEIRRLTDMNGFPNKEDRVTLMFSATFGEEEQKLARFFLRENFCFFSIGKVGTANEDVSQEILEVDKSQKRDKLLELLDQDMASATDQSGKYVKKTLVFVETKRMADFLATALSQQSYRSTSIHGDRDQQQREEALRDFRRGNCAVLVATAVAARGLDIEGVDHVINYDLPSEIDDYVHRIGRTGRVGNPGRATSFFDGAYDSSLKPKLLQCLAQAQQVVPDWMEGGGAGARANNGFTEGFAKADEDDGWS